jgi:chemotaxis protein methyltransferase CheR
MTKALDTRPTKAVQQIERLMLLLKQFAGFRASPQIQRKLERIFQNPDELNDFIQIIEKDTAKNELAALVEDLTNHETYFFRERAHLDAMEQIVIPTLVQKKKQQAGVKKIRIWSAACATGEEAYTLTMLTLNCLVKLGIAQETSPGSITLPHDWKVEVLGTDISRQAVRIAKEAIYSSKEEGLSSFRQFPQEYMRFFEKNDAPPTSGRKIYTVKKSVTNHTHFDLFNLMSTPPYQREVDVIFCRNVLIYMDAESQKTIIRSLHQALQPGGSLILSLVDSISLPTLFRENRQNRCVIYEKQ